MYFYISNLYDISVYCNALCTNHSTNLYKGQGYCNDTIKVSMKTLKPNLYTKVLP